ncbi:hypothetical protein BDZ45DRAFT_742352 [Acephala macrosclerotiorum]|nr:hypothetical protein BDZ45DRAFT_742352 [Acephala macrosclerotiorum]
MPYWEAMDLSGLFLYKCSSGNYIYSRLDTITDAIRRKIHLNDVLEDNHLWQSPVAKTKFKIYRSKRRRPDATKINQKTNHDARITKNSQSSSPKLDVVNLGHHSSSAPDRSPTALSHPRFSTTTSPPMHHPKSRQFKLQDPDEASNHLYFPKLTSNNILSRTNTSNQKN